jgi:hypothetical protein
VHLSVDPSLANKPLENVSHNDKEAGGERVTLPEAVTTSDPIPRDPVKEDGGMAGREDEAEPPAPTMMFLKLLFDQ